MESALLCATPVALHGWSPAPGFSGRYALLHRPRLDMVNAGRGGKSWHRPDGSLTHPLIAGGLSFRAHGRHGRCDLVRTPLAHPVQLASLCSDVCDQAALLDPEATRRYILTVSRGQLDDDLGDRAETSVGAGPGSGPQTKLAATPRTRPSAATQLVRPATAD